MVSILSYLRVNDYEFKFKPGLNIIGIKNSENKNVNNIGKSTLISIISRIYGESKGLNLLTNNMVKKIRNKNKTVVIEWCFSVNDKKYCFYYDTSDENSETKTILYEGKYISAHEYKKIISKLLDNEIYVINENHCIDVKFIKKSKNPTGLKDLFPHKSETYLALMFIMLLFEGEDNREDLDKLNKYFAKVAKRNSYRHLKGRYHNKMIDKIEDNSNNKNYLLKWRNLNSEKSKLKKIQNDTLDHDILKILNSLNLPIDFEKVRKFHDELVEDYNSLIDDRLLELEEEMEIINNKIESSDLSGYEPFEIDMGVQLLDYVSELDEDLVEDYKLLKPLVHTYVDSGNEIMSELNKIICELLKRNDFTNRFDYGKLGKGILETIKFETKIGHLGDGYKQVNDAVLSAFILKNTRLNIVALDTIHSGENIDLFEPMLTKISEIIKHKQYIIISFKEVNSEKFYICQEFDKPLFGFKF